jgi:hypothetical protein
MEINYVYQRLRKDFGRSAKQFSDMHTATIHETIGNPDQVCANFLSYDLLAVENVSLG